MCSDFEGALRLLRRRFPERAHRLRVFRRAAAAGRWAPGAVAAIGNFDGLHLGHRRLIGLAVRKARALSTRCLAVMFEPHPDLALGRAHRPLLPLHGKLEMLEGLGVDGAVLLAFSRRLACRSPAAFARGVIAERLKAAVVVVGRDFCFGRGRAGSAATLRDLGRDLGFGVLAVPLLRRGGQRVSSSRIRDLLAAGRNDEAQDLLGWEGPVGEGPRWEPEPRAVRGDPSLLDARALRTGPPDPFADLAPEIDDLWQDTGAGD